MDTLKNKLLVLAFGIASTLCFGQQNRSAVCRLGEIKNDSLLSYIQSLEVDCKTDANNYIQKANKLSNLQEINLKGDATAEDWQTISLNPPTYDCEMVIDGARRGSLLRLMVTLGWASRSLEVLESTG